MFVPASSTKKQLEVAVAAVVSLSESAGFESQRSLALHHYGLLTASKPAPTLSPLLAVSPSSPTAAATTRDFTLGLYSQHRLPFAE